jgi:hypothetical protein
VLGAGTVDATVSSGTTTAVAKATVGKLASWLLLVAMNIPATVAAKATTTAQATSKPRQPKTQAQGGIFLLF